MFNRSCLSPSGVFARSGAPSQICAQPRHWPPRLIIKAKWPIRARTQLPNQLGTRILRGPPRRRAAKITTKRKIALEPPGIEIVEVPTTSTAIQPPRWPTPIPRSRCARASSSVTLCLAASRWSCESPPAFPHRPTPFRHQQPRNQCRCIVSSLTVARSIAKTTAWR